MCGKAADWSQISRDMRQEGFETIGLANDYVPLSHNSAEAINAELNSEAFKSRLANLLHVDVALLAKSQFRVRARGSGLEDSLQKNPDQQTFMTAVTLWYIWGKSDGVQKQTLKKLHKIVVDYAEVRVAGHTKDYAMDSISEPPRPRTEKPTLRERILNEYPLLPGKWLVDTTNTATIIWLRPPKGSDPHVIVPPDQSEPVQLTNHLFKVVDGPVTWVYEVGENDHSIRVEKNDSQEDDPTKSKIIDAAKKEVDAWLEQNGKKDKMGSCYAFWRELKRVLKTKHNIVWLSPEDLNPKAHYD